MLVALTTALASTMLVSTAKAGTYTMRSCNVPGSKKAPVGPWKWEYAYHSVGFDDCSGGGGFGITFPNYLAMTRVSTAALRLERPTAGPRSAIALRQVRLWLSARLAGTGSFLYVVTTTSSPAGLTQTDVASPPGGNTLGNPLVSPVLPADTTAYRVVLACSGSSGSDCYPTSRRPLEIHGAEVVLEEGIAPMGSVAGGTLLADGSQSGARSVTYVAQDNESGVARVEALLGDSVVGVRDFGPECGYVEFAACPPRSSDDLVVDTRGVPDGVYPLRLRVTDAAGNRAIAQSAASIRIANRSAPKLAAQFVTTHRETLTASYGTRVAVRGRLTDAAGLPIRNAHISVQERQVSARSAGPTRQTRTDSDGRWRYKLRRHVSSRDLYFRYGAASKTLRLRVKAAAALRVSLRGTLVRYGGRIVSGPLPRRGLPVFVQGRAKGGGWQTFATRHTNRRGRFSGRYRLRVRRPGVTLQFRVGVRPTRGYPYVPGSSATRSRIVR